jgi:uncharacterized protein (DUF2147 family)
MSRLFVSLFLIALALSAPAARAAATEGIYGVWRNPKNTVHVDIRPCGTSACGYAIWASPKAQAAARRGSGKELIGMQLLRDFAPAKTGWRGKVFVPDMNITLSGAARLVDAEHLDAQGCLLAVICKHQIWTRVAEGEEAQR